MLAAAVLAAFISLTQASGTALTDAALSLPDFAQTTLSGATGWTFTNITPSGNTYTSTGTQGSITHDTDWAVLEGNRNKWSGIIQVDAQSLLNVATSGSGILLQQTNANLGGVGYNNGKETGAWTGSAYPSLTLNEKTLAQCKDGAGNLTLGVITMGGDGTAIYIVDGQKNVYSATLGSLKGTASSANIGMILTGASGVTYKQLYLFGTQVSGTDMTSMLQSLAVQAEANEFVWAGTGTSAVWDTSTPNWTKGGNPATYVSDYATTAIFDTTAAAKEAKVNSDIIAADVTVSDNYTFTVGGTSTLSIANLNVASGNKLTIGGTGTVNAGNLTGTGIIHLNEGSHFAMSTLTADNQVVSLPFEGNGTLEFETVTVKNTNGSVTFGVPTDNGAVQMTGGVVTYSGGVKHELDQLGLSYNGGQNSTVNVETDTTLHVVGKNVGYDNASRMAASMFLGHWNAQNTINVRGTLIAEAALTTWDGKVDINVENGGQLELRDGLNRNKTRENAININVVSGGVVMAGTTHNTEHTVSHDSLSVNLSDGAIFRSYYGEGETTANLGGKLNFTDGTATLDVGDATRTTTIGGTLAGEGAINKTGKGILVISGGHKTLGDTINLTEGTLTFNSDVVLDISNLSYDTQGDSLVYKLVNISEGATYTGWNSLTKNSLAGVMANSVEFKADGTVVLTTEKPHTVTWDPNWGVTGPDVLSASLTETTALITSPYKSGTDVAVELTGTGNADAYIYGVQNSDVDSTGKTYETNVWINAKEGSYKAIVGGSLCNNWGSGGALNLKGDTHIQVEGATVGTIVGGNLKDGQNPQFTGNSYISVMSGDVTDAIIGSSTNSHNVSTTQTGDTHIFVYVPLAQSNVNPLPAGGGGSSAPKNQVIGASAHVDNTAGTATLNGSTHVTIDLSEYKGTTTSFVKTIIGGHFSDAAAHTQSITGNTNVAITGGSIEFSGDIIGGNRNHNGASTIGGSVTLDITDGTYSGKLIGGSKISGSASSAVGDVVVNLGGKAQINGGVYAAGAIDTAGTGASTVASTTVNVGADVVFGTGSILSGGFGGDGVERGTITDGTVLNLTDAKAYTGLSTVTVDTFDEISVVKDASATVTAITNTPWLTKSGEGALTLALDGEFAIISVNVGAGTLTLGAADMEIMGISVDDGATLAAASGSSLQTAAITLSGGSTLAVGTEGLVLGDGSYLTMDSGKVNITTTGTLGQEVILITGLTEDDSIDGITFDKMDKSGNKYADSSDYLTLGTGLADYTQLKLKDGKLILTKAAGEGSYWGKNTGDGEWDLESLRWADDDNLTATRTFTPANAAHFTAAGLGGDINVGSAINVTTIYVSGAAYNFTGGQNLNITNGISVADSGVATFDKVTSELKNVNIAGTGSKLAITTGDVTVDAFANEGTFNAGGNLTIKSAVTAGGNVAVGGNVALASGTDNVFGSLNATGAVTGASKLTVGGTSAIGSVEGIDTLALANGTLSLGTASGLANTQLNGALTLTGTSVNLGNVTMANGSSINGKTVQASGVTVSDGTATMAGGTLQTATVAGAGKLRVASGSTVSGSNLSVANNATLELLEGSTLANEGTLSVVGRVIAGNGINLGTVNATGTVEVNGASVSATGGSIAALDMGSGETLTVANDLALTSTTGSAGTLSVTGGLTVNGAAALTDVKAGSLELTTTGTLTASGTLDAGSITLDRVSKTDHYLTAGGLSEGATAFVVEKSLIEALNLSAGQIITLADLNSDHAGADNLTINGAKYITDTHDLGYYISQDSVTKDIILTVRNQESDYVWTGAVDEHWNVDGNWSGGKVPDETSWVQFNGGMQFILLDGDTTTRRLTVSAGTDDTLYGDYALVLTQSLEVDANGCLHVGDGSTETMVSAPSVQIAGELNVQENAFVDSDQIAIKGGVLSVEDGGSAFTGQIDMTEGGSLYTYGEASVATGQLNGDPDSTVGGNVTIYGNGGRYTGGYDDAHIEVIEDADATFYAGEGLNLHGDGTAKLQYSGDTAIGGVDAGDLDIILNDPTSSNIGSTLTLQNPSAMEAGSITFGMSAIDSAATINSNRIPVIIDATDFAVGNETTVVVNQDKTQDTGIAMAVGNNGKTRNLVLARVGADNTNTDSVVLNGNLYGKYFKNARIEHGALLVDMNDTYYQTISGATSFNGRAGAGMLDDAFVENNPQISNPTGDLAAVMTALEQGAISSQEADRVLSAMSGASHAAMGAAWSRDVDRQLRAIRNRTTSMGVAECVVNEDMPFINVWINAEGDYTKLNNDGTLAGYKLSSWGGTVGVDVDFTNRFTMGLAVTAMSGDFTACSADNAEGDLDRLYVSVFGRYTHRAWTHTLVGTFGMADTDLKRTVDYGVGSYTTNSSSDGTAFGLMYEVGYTVALNENATTCLQPVLNLSYRHSSLDGCSETGTDAALRGDDVDMDVFTIALGARLQSVVGTSVYNRSSIFEGRVLCKLDAGDREASTHNSFVNVGNKHEVRSAEMGAFGLELGAGLVVPIAEDGGSIFFDVSAEIRDKYTEVNGTVGYRYNF